MELIEACNEEHAVDLFLKKNILNLTSYFCKRYYDYVEDYYSWRIDYFYYKDEENQVEDCRICEVFCQLGDHKNLSFKEMVAESLSKLVYSQYAEVIKFSVERFFYKNEKKYKNKNLSIFF
jgi:hypothetical protein